MTMGFSLTDPTRKMLAGLVFLSMVPGTQAVYAGATAPQQPQSDIGLTYASADQIRTHILDSCVLREWGRATETKSSYSERCSCYARRITADMTGEELDAFRQSGVYNASARPKAEEAQLKCSL
ncbi:hypothetical protein [Pseudochelatococcus sp. G4_1912]|uniref:hypothetical protein n=1 Tax=Pseudochelatococcus sp. G4_1912 TaxID=3114288 RepID=UPI0039C5D564